MKYKTLISHWMAAAAVAALFAVAAMAQPPKPVSDEEAELLPYYNNYLRQYHLGPEDVITVDVFGEPNYSKTGIVIPPTARIAYPLISGGVFVGGKTTDQVAAELKKRLDEYIIDPQVTVTLDKVGSARFGVLGKVAAPGVKLMNRRYSVYEAIAEAGGVASGGDSKRVVLLRMTRDGSFARTIIDLSEISKGESEVPYLLPGDQLIVPEKKWSITKIMDAIGKASAVRILFGSPF
ncbi:MAG: polysaccharide export protein [Acidobacteria bacterium]|nr:polysaccharide export protein [Acidobacteriota bacterium]